MQRRLATLLPLLAIAATRASAESDSFQQCESRNADVAIVACTMLIDTGRSDSMMLASIITQRGDAYAHKFDFEHAIKDYNHAIKLNPTHVVALVGRGIAHANRLNFELAIKDYDHAIKFKPDYAKAFYYRGLAKFGLCEIDGADEDIAKARELDPHVGD